MFLAFTLVWSMFCTREGFEGKLACWVGFLPGAEPGNVLIDKGGFKGAYGMAFMRDILRGDRFLGIFSSSSSILCDCNATDCGQQAGMWYLIMVTSHFCSSMCLRPPHPDLRITTLSFMSLAHVAEKA